MRPLGASVYVGFLQRKTCSISSVLHLADLAENGASKVAEFEAKNWKHQISLDTNRHRHSKPQAQRGIDGYFFKSVGACETVDSLTCPREIQTILLDLQRHMSITFHNEIPYHRKQNYLTLLTSLIWVFPKIGGIPRKMDGL